MEFIAKPREWGNSLGITIPKQIVEAERLNKGVELIINVKKNINLKSIRGLVKFKKSAQTIKDEMRKGWE